MLAIAHSLNITVQGCALMAPTRLRRLKLDFGQLKKNNGRPTRHSCLKFSGGFIVLVIGESTTCE